MPIISIPAHFDGKKIELDEEVELPKNARLIVTVIDECDSERQEMLDFASKNLARAYEGDDTEYSLSDCLPE